MAAKKRPPAPGPAEDVAPPPPPAGAGDRAEGMSLRDYLAGQAVVGVVSATLGPDVERHWCRTPAAEMAAHVASSAYAIADAMLAARDRRD